MVKYSILGHFSEKSTIIVPLGKYIQLLKGRFGFRTAIRSSGKPMEQFDGCAKSVEHTKDSQIEHFGSF
jgi:hypothetical protein